MHQHHAVRLVQAGTLHTRRLRLEPLDETHAKALFAGLSRDVLYEFSSDRAPEDIETLRRQPATQASHDGRESWLNWALWSVRSGGYVGVVQATVHPSHAAHIAYVFHKSWSEGDAREASVAIIDYLHDEWG